MIVAVQKVERCLSYIISLDSSIASEIVSADPNLDSLRLPYNASQADAVKVVRSSDEDPLF